MSFFIGARNPKTATSTCPFTLHLDADPVVSVSGKRTFTVRDTGAADAADTTTTSSDVKEQFSDSTDVGATMRFTLVPVPQTMPPSHALASLVHGTAMYVSLGSSSADSQETVFSETIGPNETFEVQSVSTRSYTEKLFFNHYSKQYLTPVVSEDGATVTLGGSATLTDACVFNLNTLIGTGPVMPAVPYKFTTIFYDKLITVNPNATVNDNTEDTTQNLISCQPVASAASGPSANQTFTFEACTSSAPYFYRIKVANGKYLNTAADGTLSLSSDFTDEGNNYQLVVDPIIPIRFQVIAIASQFGIRGQHNGTVSAGYRFSDDACGKYMIEPIVDTSAGTTVAEAYVKMTTAAARKTAARGMKPLEAMEEEEGKKDGAAGESAAEGADRFGKMKRVGAAAGGVLIGAMLVGAQYMSSK